MFRRSIFELSSRRRIPRRITAQGFPSVIASRKEFSTASQLNAANKPGPTGKPPESGGNFSKLFLGTAVVTGAAFLAYQSGYLDQYISKENKKHHSLDSPKFDDVKNAAKEAQDLMQKTVSSHIDEKPNALTPSIEQDVQNVESDKNLPQTEALSEVPVENQAHSQDKVDFKPEDGAKPVEKELMENSNKSVESDKQSTITPTSSEGSVEMDSSESKTGMEPHEKVKVTTTYSQMSGVPEKTEQTGKGENKTVAYEYMVIENKSEDISLRSAGTPAPLLEAYHLMDNIDDGTVTKATEELLNAMEELNNGFPSKDGKLVFDFLQAIHAAEKRQAELDALAFAEEKRAIKEKYEKELRDSRARELMRTEEAAILEESFHVFSNTSKQTVADHCKQFQIYCP